MTRDRSLILCVLCALCGSLLLSPGCGLLSKDPKMELLAARQTFSATVRIVTIARQGGAFTKSRGAEIDQYADLANQILDEWEAHLRLDESPAAAREQWKIILRKLIAAQIEAERSKAAPAVNGRSVPKGPLNGVPYEDPFNPSTPAQDPRPSTPARDPLPPAVPPATTAAGAFFARRRRRRRSPAGVVTILSWFAILTEGMILSESFIQLGQRLLAGGTATWDELNAATAQNKTDVQALHDAAKYDRPDPGPTPA